MKVIFLNIILMLFPILMYLVFSCYNVLTNKKTERMIFIVTMFTSLYLSLMFNADNNQLLLFCNIPILICFFKREGILGIILILIVVIVSYLKYDINIYFTILKYLGYGILYIFLYRRKDFNYLYFKISAVIQAFFLSFEYFIQASNIDGVLSVFLYIILIYLITFYSLYLFKLASNVSKLYVDIRKVQEENKLKNSLFKLTHEIKNPIAVCKGYLDMIDLNNIDKSKKYVRIIKGEIDRSLNVIADFTEYSKIKINKEIFDMTLLLDEIYESFSLLFESKNIKFNYTTNYDEVYLFGDYDRLKQVFVNVIKNSIESIDEDGIISMNMDLFSNYVMITIEDNGIGMDEETLANIKELFYTTKKNGTGLGVALSNEIILAHNGSIDYKSLVNVGTECIIKIPLGSDKSERRICV